jgi:tRNA 2-thiouridine synthesizing protein A
MKKMADITLNAVGKKCPMPVLMTKKELKKMSTGQTLELIVDDKGALKDVTALLSKSGDQLLETNEGTEQVTFIIKKA